MLSLKSSGTLSTAGILSAVAASVCCITPVIALVAGGSLVATNFSWIAPARPYLIGLSLTVLTFAWYAKLKQAKSNNSDCNCEKTSTISFLQTKTFLSLVTVFALLMMFFPLYAKVFYPKPEVRATTMADSDHKQEVLFTIQGMTCESCEGLVNNELTQLPGIFSYKTSYSSRTSLITFDKSKVGVEVIEAAINNSGYKVKGYKTVPRKN